MSSFVLHGLRATEGGASRVVKAAAGVAMGTVYGPTAGIAIAGICSMLVSATRDAIGRTSGAVEVAGMVTRHGLAPLTVLGQARVIAGLCVGDPPPSSLGSAGTRCAIVGLEMRAAPIATS